jgi:hypothetical protein
MMRKRVKILVQEKVESLASEAERRKNSHQVYEVMWLLKKTGYQKFTIRDKDGYIISM